MSWEEIISKGGPVVLILIGYSLLAGTIVVERLIFFFFLARPADDLETKLGEVLGRRRYSLDEIEGRGPEVNIVREMLAAAEAGVRDLNQVASRLGSAELQRMERGFRTLSVLGNTAPLLGLFGTITGMIKAFRVIELAGGRVDAQALAGGIWEAMITTGVGLAVAIPVLLLLHMLEGLADRRARTLRHYASLVLERRPGEVAEEKDEPVGQRPEVLSNAF